MNDLQTFIESNPPASRRSPLYVHGSQIQELRGRGFSFRQVAEFLATQGVETHPNNVRDWCKRNHVASSAKGANPGAPSPAQASLPASAAVASPVRPARQIADEELSKLLAAGEVRDALPGLSRRDRHTG